MIQPTHAVIPAAHLFPVSFRSAANGEAQPVTFEAWCMFVPRVGERVSGPDGEVWVVSEVEYAPHDTRADAHFILRPTVRVQRP